MEPDNICKEETQQGLCIWRIREREVLVLKAGSTHRRKHRNGTINMTHSVILAMTIYRA